MFTAWRLPMGSRKKKKKPGRKSTTASPKQKFSLKWIVLIIVVAAGAASLIVYHFGRNESDQMPVSETGESQSGPTAAIEFHKLIGPWRTLSCSSPILANLIANRGGGCPVKIAWMDLLVLVYERE